MAKKIKRSKRLEFTEKVITRFSKKAKVANSDFKNYAQNIIEGIANDDLAVTTIEKP